MATKEKKTDAAPVAEVAGIPLLVTTLHRGVFFGYGQKTDAKEITLTKARCAVRWHTDMHGVFGLAAIGPNKDCKIGPAVLSLTLQDVTSVAECTPEAAQKWESEPWR